MAEAAAAEGKKVAKGVEEEEVGPVRDLAEMAAVVIQLKTQEVAAAAEPRCTSALA